MKWMRERRDLLIGMVNMGSFAMGISLAFVQLGLGDRHLRLSFRIQVYLAVYINEWAPGEVDPLWVLGT